MRAASMVLLTLLVLQVFGGVQLASATNAGTQTPIKHVIMIMLENHSFDNIFGFYPNPYNSSNPLLQSIETPHDLVGVAPPGPLSAIPNGTYSTANPNEDVYPADFDNGKMDGFASNSGSQSMTYFGPSQYALEWDWAEDYAIADMYFSSCLCMTNPNRLFSLAGYAAGLTTDSGPPPYIPVNQSIFGELNTYGISWAYYLENPSSDIFPLSYFDGIGSYSSQIQTWDDFYGSLAGGSLPSVSWVMATGGGSEGLDQHPSDNVTQGEQWLLGVVNHVMQSSYWNSSAIFITYDEGGGYYDHVVPPELDGVQLGFRIPLIVISPYVKENYVSHTVMNHASMLSFVDYNWKLPALNQYVADSGLPIDMFDFGQNTSGGPLPRVPVILGNDSSYPVEPQVPFASLPYQRDGSFTGTLASMGAADFVTSNTFSIPFYESLPFTVVVAVVLVALLVLVARFARSRRRSILDSGSKLTQKQNLSGA
jgi:phospholipase C